MNRTLFLEVRHQHSSWRSIDAHAADLVDRIYFSTIVGEISHATVDDSQSHSVIIVIVVVLANEATFSLHLLPVKGRMLTDCAGANRHG